MSEANNDVDNVDVLLGLEHRELTIGTRTQQKIAVYPLAYVDQKKIGMKIMNSMQKAGEGFDGDKLDSVFLGKLAEILEKNIPILITKCTDMEEKVFMALVSAGQLMDFITIIMEVNFLNPIQKGTNLLTSMGSLYEPKQSLPKSVSDTPID